MTDQELLGRIKELLPDLEATLHGVNSHWNAEDRVYRYYHRSFKVYGLQKLTKDIYMVLGAMGPIKCPMFDTILAEGTGHQWCMGHNVDWQEARRIVEAFFHARHMLEMVVKYGKELSTAPTSLPSGWATVLYLYGIR